jgi:HD-like signal output (HDOD) protein
MTWASWWSSSTTATAVVARLQSNRGQDVVPIETEVFGASHQDFGAALCERWNLPPSLACAAGSHHHPLAPESSQRMLPSHVYVADRLALACQPGFVLDSWPEGLDADVLDLLALTREQVDAVAEGLPQAVAAAESFLTGD